MTCTLPNEKYNVVFQKKTEQSFWIWLKGIHILG